MRVTVVVQTATKIFNGLKAQNERVLLRSAARSFYTSTLSKSKLINEPITSLQPSLSSLHLLCSLSDDEKRNKKSTSSQPLLLSSIWNKQQYQQQLHPHGSSLILGKAYYSRRVTGSSSQRRVQYKERENETEQAQVVDDQIQKQEQQQQQQQQQSSNDYESDMKQHEALTPGSIQHMRKVYSTMFASSAIATSGALIGMATGFMTPLLGLAAIVPLIALERTDLNSSPTVRMGLASAFSFLSGMGIAPLIKYAFIVNPVAIPFSLAVTTGIFGAMTFASLVAKKGSFLKMGVPLFGATIGLMLLGLGSFFVPASSIFYPLVTSGFSYLGVGLFSLFIAYDNQRILSEYEQGERDTLKHGLSMFINIKNLFSFLLSIFSSSRD